MAISLCHRYILSMLWVDSTLCQASQIKWKQETNLDHWLFPMHYLKYAPRERTFYIMES